MKGIVIPFRYSPLNISNQISKMKAYEDVCCRLAAILGKAVAERIIQIVQDESNEYERRIAFFETTIEAAYAGCDYSQCETIKDMSRVYGKYFVRKTLSD